MFQPFNRLERGGQLTTLEKKSVFHHYGVLCEGGTVQTRHLCLREDWEECTVVALKTTKRATRVFKIYHQRHQITCFACWDICILCVILVVH